MKEYVMQATVYSVALMAFIFAALWITGESWIKLGVTLVSLVWICAGGMMLADHFNWWAEEVQDEEQ